MKYNNSNYIAVLIDGDNISYKYCEQIIEQSKKYGKILISRVYGDFSQTELKNWRTPSITYNIDPIIVWRVSGKNSSDLRLTADVIEIMNETPTINKFILVSGDKDYTTIVNKLKIKGKYVVGISMNTIGTSYLLRNCCDEFIILNKEEKKKHKKNFIKNNNIDTNNNTNVYENEDIELTNLKKTIVEIIDNTDGNKIDISQLKYKLLQIDSSFIETNYGYNSFGKLLQSMKDILNVKLSYNKIFVHLIDKKEII